jgi:signal transduction histidine kinase
MEPILQEWEDFARSLGAVSEAMDTLALRDHAKQMLQAVALDLETNQSEAEQEAKSKGDAPPPLPNEPDSAAQTHGSLRAEEGFSLQQMVSEYRALRASVLRLWSREESSADHGNYQQLMRFNEAIDEALADSIETYAQAVDRMFAARARERLVALGTLSAGLGHDMANVLLPMASTVDELAHLYPGPPAAPLVESLRRSVSHLRGLAKGLRSLTLDPDHCALTPEHTVLSEWWTHAISPFTWALPRGVQLHAQGMTSGTLPPVLIPAHVLMQAVFNLVQNAADAHARGVPDRHGGGFSGNIWISAAPADGAVHLTVRDDGPGMDPETQARCTRPFFTTKPRGSGTGLGLALVRTAMERHGGQLVVESTPGQGSAFTLQLPIAIAPARK